MTYPVDVNAYTDCKVADLKIQMKVTGNYSRRLQR